MTDNNPIKPHTHKFDFIGFSGEQTEVCFQHVLHAMKIIKGLNASINIR